MSRRARVIDAVVERSRRETFLGSAEARERAARVLLKTAGDAGEPDLTAVLDHVRKVPLPLLKGLADQGLQILIVRGSVGEHRPDLGGTRPAGHPPLGTWTLVRTAYSVLDRQLLIATGSPHRGPRALAPPPGAMLLRELGRAIDLLLADPDRPSERLAAAQQESRPLLDGFHGQDDAVGREELFAELFSRVLRADKRLREELPPLAEAMEAVWAHWIRVEEDRNDSTRTRARAWFLRHHVLGNQALTGELQDWLSRRVTTHHGPWERSDVERHVRGVVADPTGVVIETQWGPVRVCTDDKLDSIEREAVVERFLDRFVRSNALLTQEHKTSLERRARREYGPWHVDADSGTIKSLTVRRGRLVFQTAQGFERLEGDR